MTIITFGSCYSQSDTDPPDQAEKKMVIDTVSG